MSRRWKLRGLVALVVALGALLSGGHVRGDDIVLAVNKTVGLTHISRATAKRVLSGRESSWPNGTPVALVLPPSASASMAWLVRDVMGMPASVYRRFVAGQVFKGVLSPPTEPPSVNEARHAVATKVGAVTALPRAAVPSGANVLELD